MMSDFREGGRSKMTPKNRTKKDSFALHKQVISKTTATLIAVDKIKFKM